MAGRAAGIARLLLQCCDAILGICSKMESSHSHGVGEISLRRLTFTGKSFDFGGGQEITKRRLVANFYNSFRIGLPLNKTLALPTARILALDQTTVRFLLLPFLLPSAFMPLD